MKTIFTTLLILFSLSLALESFDNVSFKSKDVQKTTTSVYGEMPNEYDIKFDGIVRLATTDGQGFCTAWVIDRNYAITAAHCISEKGKLKKSYFKLFDKNGKDTDILVKAEGCDSNTDLGLLTGDFRTIRPLSVNLTEEGFNQSEDSQYITCGYPLGQKHLSCTPFKFIKMDNFNVLGKSHLIPGMSGGPVIDVLRQQAVAVNSAVEEEYSIVSPVQGFLGLFDLE